MSLNISKKILAISKVTVEVNVSSMSPRQQKNLKLFVQSGIIAGNSVPATMAKKILESRDLPFLWTYRKYSTYVYMRNCPIGSRGHEMVKELYAQSVMEGGDDYDPDRYTRIGGDTTVAYVEGKTERTHVELHPSAVKSMFKNVSFDHEVEIGEVITMTFGKNDWYRSL